MGVSIGLAVENFDFGILYNFPFQSPGAVYSPSIFELFVTFDLVFIEEIEEDNTIVYR